MCFHDNFLSKVDLKMLLFNFVCVFRANYYREHDPSDFLSWKFRNDTQNQQQTVNSVNGSENVYSVLITRALLSKAKSNIELFCSYCNLRMLNYDLFDSLMVLCNWLKHVWNCFAMETKINFIIFKERIRNRETFSFS